MTFWSLCVRRSCAEYGKENNDMKIIIDAMGGDNAPMEIVKGALNAHKNTGVEIVLVGKEEEILRDANAEAARVLERAEEQIELEKKRAINEVKDEVSGLAIEIAGAVIGRDVSDEEHRDLIDEFISGLGDSND